VVLVEGCKLVLCMNIIVHGPAVVSVIITFPLDKIFKTAPMDAAIEDLIDLKFHITFN